jgi:integrase/recombinase XerD
MISKTHLEIEDVTAIETAAENLRDKLLIRILKVTGCRISEILGLTIDDIDFTAEMIRIEHLKVRLELYCPSCNARIGKSCSYCAKCGKSVTETVSQAREHRRLRTLPVDSETVSLLKSYIDQGGAVEKGGRKLIFHINRHRAWQVIKYYSDKAGLPPLLNPESGKYHHVSPHKFRDFLAVQAMKHDDSGDGLRLLQEHLGHASFNTTAKYRKVSGVEHREWYNRLWDERKE